MPLFDLVKFLILILLSPVGPRDMQFTRHYFSHSLASLVTWWIYRVAGKSIILSVFFRFVHRCVQ